MRRGVGHGEGDGLLPVAICPHADAKSGAYRTVPAIRAEQAAGRDPGSVTESDQSSFAARGQPRESDARAQGDLVHLLDPGQYLAPQEPVRQVPSEGEIVPEIRGIKGPGDQLWSTGIDDPHDFQIGGKGGQPIPKPDAVQKLPRWLQEGSRSQIGAFALRIGDRRRRIDAEDGEAGCAEGRRRGQAGDTTTGDEDIHV